MKSEKEISIDQFTDDEKVLVEQRVKTLTDKLSPVASKKEEKEILNGEIKSRIAHEEQACCTPPSHSQVHILMNP